jgi:c(7)-type cytochrome triheme protein
MPRRSAVPPRPSRRSRGLPGRLALLAAVAVVACSSATSQKVLPAVVDGAPQPGQEGAPPKRKVRADLSAENEQLKKKLAAAEEAAKEKEKRVEAPAPPVEKAKTWAEAEKILPKDKYGLVEWSKALAAGAVVPRPGAAPGAPVQASLDRDVEVAPARNAALFAVTFDHAPHTQWLACSSCHPSPYPLGKNRKPVTATMEDMEKGKSCGACHGPAAFSVREGCLRCHPKSPAVTDWKPREVPRKPIEKASTWSEAAKLLPSRDGAPDWSRALDKGVIAPRAGVDPKAKPEDTMPDEIVRTPAGDVSAKTVFPHKAHTEQLKCDSCHPAPYEMAGGATKMSMDTLYKGQHCGSCHGTVAFGLDQCAWCHPAMGGGK